MSESDHTVVAIAARVRAGEQSAVEVAESFLGRIEASEPHLGAFLEVQAERALRVAGDIDRRRAAGEALGALAGVPVALKDNLSVEGQSLTCASKVLVGYQAPYTATAVEKLLSADAVPVGRLNMDEFAMGSSCENSAFQVTRNPWDLQKVPGGSSGGSAAAVAAGCVPLALGSDTGGSIRQPAAFCGVVGMKPTWGRVSRYGLVAFASSLDQIGPLTRDVRDAALTTGVIAGYDHRDATSARAPVADYLAAIDEGVSGLRVGVVEEIDTGALPADARASWSESLAALEAAGAELRPVSVPNLPSSVALYYVLANCEASANLARFDGVRYGHRSEHAGSLLELYEESREEGLGAEVKRRILLGTFALSSGYYDAYYGRARGVLEALRRQFATAFESVDLIASPTCPGPAFGIGEKVDDPLEMYLQDTFTTPASLAGLPAISVPSGFDSAGLPLGLQLMAKPFDEALLFSASAAFEARAGFGTPVARGLEGALG